MDNTSIRVHWLTFTVFGGSPDSFKQLWQDYFQPWLGELSVMPGGVRRGFQETYRGLSGSHVYTKPLQVSEKGDYYSIELPGSACDCIPPDVFVQLSHVRSDFERWGDGQLRVSRLDLAIDYCPFTPKMVYEHFKADLVKTRARRSSVSWDESPYEKRENGGLGTSTLYIGRGSSERMIRIYDKRGYTRLELQSRDNWADVTFGYILQNAYNEWMPLALGFIDKYFSVKSAWWLAFTQLKQTISIVVSSVRVVTLNKMVSWVTKQVAPTIHVLTHVLGEQELRNIVRSGVSVDRLQKFIPVLQLGV